MPKFDERLYCSNCHQQFFPDKKHLLSSNEERFKKQLFMIGQHPTCGNEFAGYLGIIGKEATYLRIPIKQAQKWYDRFDADLIKVRPVKIKDGQSKKRMATVHGFKQEINSGKWMEQIQAVK